MLSSLAPLPPLPLVADNRCNASAAWRQQRSGLFCGRGGCGWVRRRRSWWLDLVLDTFFVVVIVAAATTAAAAHAVVANIESSGIEHSPPRTPPPANATQIRRRFVRDEVLRTTSFYARNHFVPWTGQVRLQHHRSQATNWLSLTQRVLPPTDLI